MGSKGSTFEGSFTTVVQLGVAVVCILLNSTERPTNLETGNSLSDEMLRDNAVRCEKGWPFNIYVKTKQLNDNHLFLLLPLDRRYRQRKMF